MIRSSPEDQRLFLICSTSANSSTGSPPPPDPSRSPLQSLHTPPTLLFLILFHLVILSNHMADPPLQAFSRNMCQMEMRSINFRGDGMGRSVDRSAGGGVCDGEQGPPPTHPPCGGVSIERRLHRRLVAVKCGAPLADTKRDSQEAFQTSPLLVRDYSLGCYPITL